SDLPGAIAVLAVVLVAAAGVGQLTEVVTRRRAAPTA
ncbi:MAG: hypothetical protein JWN57_1200, partial [Frankiales bacterium]|nr:hypothetical protein [Frankiales bacterium]